MCGDGLFQVPDARRDRRFKSPVVFYAAIPLRSPDGRTFGIVSVLDFAPRELDRREREGFAAGTAWADIPDRWCCPDCGVREKVDFVPLETSAAA